VSGFVLHPEVYNDLVEIWEYMARDSFDAADRTIEEIYAKISSLVAFPKLGQHRPDLTARPLRFHRVRDYVIGYSPDETPLVVLAVIHGRRNPRVIAAILGHRE
jgi:plasmid stabilization system protein ParE